MPATSPRPNRRRRQEIAEETVALTRAGRYHAPSGTEIDIADAVERAVGGTVLYTPERPPPRAAIGSHRTAISLALETTLTGARRFHDAGEPVAALVFGSARNPGGGFLSGSEAQEESLARASALYACQEGSPFYDFHRARRDARYSHHVLYAPDVPVIRDDTGALLERWWPCSFITAAAVNRGALEPHQHADVTTLMRERIARVLDVASAHGHRAIVLGAFGCGVFRNDPDEVAAIFADTLATTHAGVFEHVRFSVYDAADGATCRAFAERFSAPGRAPA